MLLMEMSDSQFDDKFQDQSTPYCVFPEKACKTAIPSCVWCDLRINSFYGFYMHGFIVLLSLIFYKIQNYWLPKCCQGKRSFEEKRGDHFSMAQAWQTSSWQLLQHSTTFRFRKFCYLFPKCFVFHIPFNLQLIPSGKTERGGLNIPNGVNHPGF